MILLYTFYRKDQGALKSWNPSLGLFNKKFSFWSFISKADKWRPPGDWSHIIESLTTANKYSQNSKNIMKKIEAKSNQQIKF